MTTKTKRISRTRDQYLTAITHALSEIKRACEKHSAGERTRGGTRQIITGIVKTYHLNGSFRKMLIWCNYMDANYRWTGPGYLNIDVAETVRKKLIEYPNRQSDKSHISIPPQLESQFKPFSELNGESNHVEMPEKFNRVTISLGDMKITIEKAT